jgi:hypothetical protein
VLAVVLLDHAHAGTDLMRDIQHAYAIAIARFPIP